MLLNGEEKMSSPQSLARFLATTAALPNARMNELTEWGKLLGGADGPAWNAVMKRVRKTGLPERSATVRADKPSVLKVEKTAPKFTAWRTFLIGGVDKKALQNPVEARFSFGKLTKDLMRQPAFMTLDKEKEIDTIILTPADLGYEGMPMTCQLLDPIRLAGWSQKYAHLLPEGYAVELLPAEAGPHICDQYKEQPSGEILRIAMRLIMGCYGVCRIFCIKRDGVGEQWLDAEQAHPGIQWDLDDRFVFRLRKVTQN